MMGWANAVSLTEIMDVKISVFLPRSSRIDPHSFRGINFQFEEVYRSDQYKFSYKLQDMIWQANVVHVFSPFTPVGEMAVLMSEAINRPVAATDYGLRTTSSSSRIDVRHVIRYLVQPAEIRRSPVGLPRKLPNARSIDVPFAPMVSPPNPLPQVERSGTLLVRPNVGSPDALATAHAQGPLAPLFVFRDLMSDEDLYEVKRSWAGFGIKIVSIDSLNSLLSFYASLSGVWDLGGKTLGHHAFLPDVQRFAIREAQTWGVKVRQAVQADGRCIGPAVSADPTVCAKNIGEALLRYYAEIAS
jgi:hypothetical protein